MDIETNSVQESKELHKVASYYNAQSKLSEEAQQLLHGKELVTQGGQPQLLQQAPKQQEKTVKPITKYNFMNDGIWMKVLIDRSNYPDIINTKFEQMKIEFHDEGFHFSAPQTEYISYDLVVLRTARKIIPEKSKMYERKGKIYIALYKEKEDDWWQLKY